MLVGKLAKRADFGQNVIFRYVIGWLIQRHPFAGEYLMARREPYLVRPILPEWDNASLESYSLDRYSLFLCVLHVFAFRDIPDQEFELG